MQCYIYKSPLKTETYLYLLDKDDLSIIPEVLLKLFGEPEYCFDFVLTEGKKLFQEDSKMVIQNLLQQGYHLQMSDANVEAMLSEMAS